jgi:hypothetical protein
MERLEEEFDAWNAEVKQTLLEAAADIRATAKANREHERRMRAYEKKCGLLRHPTGAPAGGYRGSKT